ncbi:PH domain-containing protein [Mucilaginibacter mali]|uniref:PH domain-containing protein n=1 Tax=Mucilaginibacter mali TaxID=2740462 RepID=A0A7D4QCP6_9SPHI|nr:PH domain-containing protein [Mucilaginibacter mali]QKJ31264.1 PH domain-containing protein [Mucilaginibacter mali]
MNQEFTLGNGTKIVYGLLGAGLAAFAIFFFAMPRNPNVSYAVYSIPLLFLLGSVLMFINIARRRVIIAGDTITRANVFGTREMAFDQIKGCRIGQKVIIIEPLDASAKRMTITNYIDYADDEVLVNYLRERFTDLDAADLQKSEKEFADDNRFGFNTDDRKAALEKATAICTAYNIIGFTGGFALIILRGGRVAVICEIVYPVIGIFLMAFSHGLIKFLSNKKRSVYPFIGIGFLIAAISLLIRSLINYEILGYDKLLLPSFGIALAMFIPLYYWGINREAESPKGQAIMMLVVSLIFGFGLTRTLNCQYDDSAPRNFNTTVLSKYISSGKGAHYHITLNPWHNTQSSREIDVSQSEYDRIQIADPVTIHEKQGYLHVPWFYVDL